MTDVKTKTQKIIKVGNSYAITLDKKYMDKVGLKVNDSVAMTYQADPNQVTLSKLKKSSVSQDKRRLSREEKKQALASKISPELQEWVEKFIDENQEALDELAVS